MSGRHPASEPGQAGARPGWRSRLGVALNLAPFAAGYFLSYLFRTINGPIAGSLVDAFGLGPRGLGLLTATYFLTFAACQIPAGLLIDRFGPHRVQAALLVLAAAGALMCAAADAAPVMMLGRAMIGAGCAGAFVTGVKALSLWLPRERRALGNAGLVMCGGLGAVASTTPIEWLMEAMAWRQVFGVLAVATLLVAVLVRRGAAPAAASDVDARGMLRGLLTVVRDRRFWRVAPLSGAVIGASFAIHGLWAARYLADVGHVDAHGVNLAMMGMGGMLIVGALMLGVLATLARRAGVTPTMLLLGFGLVAMLLELGLADVPAPHPVVLLCIYAVFGSMTVLSFTIIGELFPPALVGRANGALNVLHLGGAFVMQAAIGWVVSCWPPLPDGHSPGAAYTAALGMVVLVQVVSLGVFVVLTPGSSRPWRWAGRAGRGRAATHVECSGAVGVRAGTAWSRRNPGS